MVVPTTAASLRALVRAELLARAQPKVRQRYERYFLGAISFLGVKTPGVQAVMRDLRPRVAALPEREQRALGLTLLRSPYMEERQLGTRVLHRLGKRLPEGVLDDLARVFDVHVRDWASCDQLAGRVLRELIRRPTARPKVMAWSRSKNPWRQRASAVAFVNEARHGQLDDEILAVCTRLVRNPHRFVQLGAGWVLRELSLADRPRVLRFLDEHGPRMSREGLRYAVEKLPAAQRRQVLARTRAPAPARAPRRRRAGLSDG